MQDNMSDMRIFETSRIEVTWGGKASGESLGDTAAHRASLPIEIQQFLDLVQSCRLR